MEPVLIVLKTLLPAALVITADHGGLAWGGMNGCSTSCRVLPHLAILPSTAFIKSNHRHINVYSLMHKAIPYSYLSDTGNSEYVRMHTFK